MGEGSFDCSVLENFFDYRPSGPEKVKEGNPDKESSERVEKYQKYAEEVQRLSGVTSFVDEILITKSNLFSGPAAPEPIDWDANGRRIVGFVEVLEGTSDFGVAHEISHQVLWGEVAKLSPDKVHFPIGEGLCDLVALEVVYNDMGMGKDYLTEITHDLAEHYRRSITEEDVARFQQSEDPSQLAHRDRKESLGHAMGRRFCYSVRDKFSEAPLRLVVNQILSHPPTEDEIAYPERYLGAISELDSKAKSQSPKEIRIELGRKRLI